MVKFISKLEDAAKLSKCPNVFRIERHLSIAKQRAMLRSRRGEWWGCDDREPVCEEYITIGISEQADLVKSILVDIE